MSKKNLSLYPALVAVSAFTVLVPQEGSAQSAEQSLWSDPTTWPNAQVPVAGDKVVIARDKNVLLDISPPALGGLSVDGKLTFSNDVDLELTTEWIMLHGELAVGSEDGPHTRNATITLTDDVKGEDVMAGMGDRGIMISGGTLNLHGDRTHTWTKLSATAEAGSTAIEVLDASGWRVGDEIVLASTDYNPRQAEVRRIAAIRGNRITLDEPLEYMHFGKITFDVDERGEVGLLTRNIKIQASPDAEQSFFGGHIMAMPSSKMYVSGVELHRMGQNLTLARYPIHWHLVGDASGQYIKNAAIHDTFNRCVTVHGTHNLQVENNVTYNNVGHCFFLEDGIETGNRFVRNLAIQTKCHTSKPCVSTNLAASGETRNGTNGQQSQDVLLPSDNTVASFWITNPNNHFVGNVAAGSDANGFWMSLPEHPNGQFLGTEISQATWPRRTPIGEFRGNVAHSNYDGFMFDRNINPDNTFGVTGSSHTALANPADPDSEPLVSVFEDLTTYKNRNGGIWGRGEMHLFRNVKFADNAMGFTHASGAFGRYDYTSQVVDSLFVGETENVGNPTTAAERAYGRSLPKPELPDFPIRGYEFYDYRHDVIDTLFVNYQDNDTREAGAISNLMFSSFGVSTNNAIENVEFVEAKPVHFPPMEAKWGSDNGGSTSYTTAAYKDRDGSLGGGPNSYVLIHDGVNNSIAVDPEACEIKPDWNAAVCPGDVGRLSVGGGFGGGRGGRGGFGGGGFGGGRGGAATAQPPVVLSRLGMEFTLTGATNVRSGTEIKVTTERENVNLSLTELDAGSAVIFELPGFTTAASGTAQSSLDAMRKASETSYFKDEDTLWVKVVSNGDPGNGAPGNATAVQVSR